MCKYTHVCEHKHAKAPFITYIHCMPKQIHEHTCINTSEYPSMSSSINNMSLQDTNTARTSL